MLRSIFRFGFVLGAASTAVYLFRRYYGSNWQRAGLKARSAARDIGRDLARKDQALTASLEEVSRSAV